MKSEDLYKAIGEIGEDLLARSEQTEDEKDPGQKMRVLKKSPVRTSWFRYAAAAAACILVIAGGAAALRGFRTGNSAAQDVAEEKAVTESAAAAGDVYEEAAEEVEEAAPMAEEVPAEAAPAETAEEEAEAGKEMPAEKEEAASNRDENKEAAVNRDADEDSWEQEPWQRSDENGAVLVSAVLETGDAGAGYAEISEEMLQAVRAFEADSAAIILGEDRSGENKVYSPLNLYAAMSMLAGVTSGEAREELIAALGGEDLPMIREAAAAMISRASVEKSNAVSRAANSLWLRKGTSYKLAPLLQLGEWYNASVFSGKMGSPEYNTLLKDWINDNTEGLLGEYAENAGFSDLTTIALASSLYYKAPWQDPFYGTERKTFHTPSGDKEVEMMYAVENFRYYQGTNYEAAALPLQDGNEMVLFLPEENISAEVLASEKNWMQSLTDRAGWDENARISLEVPKYDISQKLELQDAFNRMGVISVFTDWTSFDGVLDGDNALTQAEQVTRVITDENGVTAAAYTVEAAAAEADLENEIVELIFDRPFLFAITDRDGVIRFAGVVNEP